MDQATCNWPCGIHLGDILVLGSPFIWCRIGLDFTVHGTYIVILNLRQVREVIGITLSVLCSNLRLSATFGQTHSINYGDSRMVESPQRDDWATVLTDRASELAMNIQSMESLADMADENGSINMEAQADVRRMETVFILVISLKCNFERSTCTYFSCTDFSFSKCCSCSILLFRHWSLEGLHICWT